MQNIIDGFENLEREEIAEILKKKAILANHGRLLQILINVFAEKKYVDKLQKREGQKIQINFPGYDPTIDCLTFVLSKSPSDPYIGPSRKPKCVITFKVKEEKVISTLADVVSTKYNLFGLLKLIFKYLLTGKIRYKPKRSLGALLATLRCLLIGNNEMLKNSKKRRKEGA